MEEKKKRCCCKSKSSAAKNPDTLPGVTVNEADKDKVSPELVKERTKALNNNPRNNDE